MGFGSVIKVVLEFTTPFWQAQLPELEFLLSDAPVPTWWGQLTGARPLLTGWLAGPPAERLRDAPASMVLEQALASLSYLLAVPPAELAAQLCASYVGNWSAEPYACGAYSYPTVGAEAARATLAAPVADTLFFAGEALYQGAEGGTVEAALTSGQATARILLGHRSF